MATPIHFSKVIRKVETDLERMKIPERFTLKYGSALSNPVLLKTPDGTEWKVYWTKQNDDEVWFKKGWKEFAQNYYLNYGYVVVFNYRGTSHLDVLILGSNAVEIDYLSRVTCDENNILDHSDDESIQISDSNDESDEISNSDDESYEISDSGDESYEISDSDDECSDLQPKEKSPLHKKMIGESSTARRTQSLSQPKKARAKQVAKAFISDHPFITLFITFRDVMGYKKYIPHLKDYVEMKEKNAMLCVGERSWKVKMLWFNKSFQRCFSTACWSKFVKENKLQLGDVCVLELIKREEPTFIVHVTKHNS